jgi:hypothetical protein
MKLGGQIVVGSEHGRGRSVFYIAGASRASKSIDARAR